METPSSVKRLGNNVPFSKKHDDSGSKSVKSSRRREVNQQKPLIDITNDSPIVGLASGSFLEETPSSAVISSKQRGANKRFLVPTTPGSGEALLRDQVKTLLQKVEEEAELSKLTAPPFTRINHHGFIRSSPMGLLAPTPANTPQVSDLLDSFDSGLTSVTPSIAEQQVLISQGVTFLSDGKKQGVAAAGHIESQKSLNRTLLFDFSDKSDLSSDDCTSQVKSLTHTTDEDSCSSVRSVRIKVSAKDEEESEGGDTKEYYCSYNHADDTDDYDSFQGETEDEFSLDALCDGLNKINMNGSTKFTGKHSRFVYDSDNDEIAEVVTTLQEEEEVDDIAEGALRLKGFPTPKGKHIHFPDEEEN